MRTILFRAKKGHWEAARDAGETTNWMYGNLDASSPRAYCVIYSRHSAYGEPYGVACDPDTLGQYTGRKTRNGTKVFEGDIVAFNTYDYNYRLVQYDNELMGFVFVDSSGNKETANDVLYKLKDMYVVGNIYDDPELFNN